MTIDLAIAVKKAVSHSECIICGDDNQNSLRLSFRSRGDGSVVGSFVCRPELQGYKGVLHGGVVASLLDAAMTHCLFHKGIEALTADLHVRYFEPVKCGSIIEVVARILFSRKSFFRLEAEIRNGSDLMARADASFMLPRMQ